MYCTCQLACVLIKLFSLCHAWVILITNHFLNHKIRVSAWIFWNFSSQLKIRYLRQLCFKFLQLNDFIGNDLVLKLVDNFLASRHTSLTTKSSDFVWSITWQNLNQFQKNLFVGISMKSFICLLNLRKISDGGFTFPFFWFVWHGMALWWSSGGWMPVRIGRLFSGVGRKHLVTIYKASLMVVSIRQMCEHCGSSQKHSSLVECRYCLIWLFWGRYRYISHSWTDTDDQYFQRL